MRTKNKIVIIMCCLIFVMVIGYAAFSTNLNINGTANIASTWKVEFTNIEEVSKSSGVTVKTAPTASGTMATFDVAFTSPGDSIEYDITIKNNGTLDAVIDSIKTTNTGSDAIKFEISGVTEGDTLAKQATTKVKVKISYDSSVTTQPTSLSRTLTLNIIYVQNVSYSITDKPTSSVDDSSDVVFKSEANVASFVRVEVDNKVVDPANYTVTEGSTIITLKKEFLATLTTGTHTLSIVSKNGTATTTFEKKEIIKLSTQVLKDNTAQADTNIDFSQISSDKNGKGLYYTSTNTEDNKTTYYFRGAVKNNYVSFAGFTWRIIRINEDGSVRLIKQDSIGNSTFNTTSSDNAYVGYMYGTAGSSTYEATHANINSSTIKTMLDTWYRNNLTSYSSIIADAGFCGDRNPTDSTGIGTTDTVYGVFVRLSKSYAPQYKCPQNNDLYTTTTSTKGNKSLTYPIGLITADEVAYAGGTYNKTNESYYLMNGNNFWTISPCTSAFKAFTLTSVWGVTNKGSVNITFDVRNNYAVQPVINLKSTVGITNGDGTSSNPYVIKTN